mmetsp:Transcript_30364/g.73911  ORF Transcript_30364/g.73911 Transcript_30364/m.73911 type:complete len:92 (-) Transcript_30364:1889-2164(-)
MLMSILYILSKLCSNKAKMNESISYLTGRIYVLTDNNRIIRCCVLMDKVSKYISNASDNLTLFHACPNDVESIQNAAVLKEEPRRTVANYR